jgi:uncharacterized protein YndB with AHSA1/START domain
MSERSTEHATFTIERTYGASPERVFAAWSDPQIKYRWFGPPAGPENKLDMDFRIGGHERFAAGINGVTYTYDALYQDIVEGERIVYTYEMHRDEDRMSVCVSTVELRPEGDGTKLTYTEQGVFLDGHDTAAQREHGTREILDKLETALVGA